MSVNETGYCFKHGAHVGLSCPTCSVVAQSQPKLEWQRCPICSGSGRLWDTLMPTQTVLCHGCGGRGMVVGPDPSMVQFRLGGST